MITFDKVTKRFPGGTVAVDNLSLDIPAGRITALVGSSGSGKTTTLRMINRVIEPTSGVITFDGVDTRRIDPITLRRRMGYVLQSPALFPTQTVTQNIMTVPNLLKWPKKKAEDRAAELIELVGLTPEMGGRYANQLSGGQQQRVGVARALAADPPVLLMDEPFSAVDPIVRAQLQDELLALQDKIAKTIVIVTHDIDEAIKLGDLIAVFRPGGVLAQLDTPQQLLGAPADAFVAAFVGRDRGYRGLGFKSAADLPIHVERAITLGESIELAALWLEDGWSIVVDDDERPLGWLSETCVRVAETSGSEVVSLEAVNLGGTVARRSGSLREALDASLSAPSSRGIITDDDGRLIGTVRAHEVIYEVDRVG
ncbi:MAG: ABC transporter ATP-binding protein [Humibacter sp.]